MCEWHGGTYEGNLPVKLAHPYSYGKDTVYVDECMQKLVQAINDAGIMTLNCCCGHGIQPGWIALEDGRHILIVDSLEEVHKMTADYPSLTDGCS